MPTHYYQYLIGFRYGDAHNPNNITAAYRWVSDVEITGKKEHCTCKERQLVTSSEQMTEFISSTTSVHIQGVSGGIVNILGGGSIDYSE
jgi:hypothetical protein